MKKGSIVYESASDKEKKKDSSFIRYKIEGNVHRGIVTSFEKHLDCPEGPKHFAKVQNLDCTIAFETLHSNHELIGTYSYTVTDRVDEVPIMDITGICVNVKVGDKSYVIYFVHNNFFQ